MFFIQFRLVGFEYEWQMITDITDPNISFKILELFTYYDVIYQSGTVPGDSSGFS